MERKQLHVIPSRVAGCCDIRLDVSGLVARSKKWKRCPFGVAGRGHRGEVRSGAICGGGGEHGHVELGEAAESPGASQSAAEPVGAVLVVG